LEKVLVSLLGWSPFPSMFLFKFFRVGG
jgi:hypothetical protein